MPNWKYIFTRSRPGLTQGAAAHIGWTLLSAVLLLLAFPQPGWGWLAYVALVPVTVLAIRSTSPRLLTVCVYGVFTLWWVWMLRWLMPVTGGGSIGLGAFMAAYWTAAILVVRHIHRAYRSAMVITLPLVWVSFEVLRGSAPQGGFGWFCLGHAQAPYLPGQSAGYLIQIADIFGQYGVSFLVAMTNGLIVDYFTRSLLKRKDLSARRVSRTLTVGTLLWVASMMGAWGYGLLKFREEAAAVTRTVQVAVVQTAVVQSNKEASQAQKTGQGAVQDEAAREKQRAQEEKDWQQLIAMTRQAAASQPQPEIIIWPETMVPRPINPDAVEIFREFSDEHIRAWARYTEQIAFLAADLRTNLVVGAGSMTFTDERPQPFTANSVFLYDWRGVQYPQRYDKIHRVPFGEYIPWVSEWPWLKQIFIDYFSPYKFDYSLTAGTKLVVFPVTSPPVLAALAPAVPTVMDNPVRIVTPICFEDSVPRLVRSMVYEPGSGKKRADIIVNLTNDGWFSGTDQPLQHLQIAALRSIELRVPTARAVNMGISGFVDAMGRVGPRVQQGDAYTDVPGVATARIKIDGRSSFYGSAGPWGTGVMGFVTIVLALTGVFRRIRQAGGR